MGTGTSAMDEDAKQRASLASGNVDESVPLKDANVEQEACDEVEVIRVGTEDQDQERKTPPNAPEKKPSTPEVTKSDDGGDDADQNDLTKPPSFAWNWIDPNIDGICGFNKCFFHGKKNNSITPSSEQHYGYLIAYNINNNGGGADGCNLTIGWEMGMYIERTYKLHHLYDPLYPPIDIQVTNDLIEYTKTQILPKVKKILSKLILLELNSP